MQQKVGSREQDHYRKNMVPHQQRNMKKKENGVGVQTRLKKRGAVLR
jgi:hypothetical protein